MRFLVRLIALVALGYLLGFAAFMLSLDGPLDARKTDAIVVYTGGQGRVDRGLEMMKRGLAKRMLISGAGAGVRPVELAIRYGAPMRLFRCCIDLGYEAVDTRSNAEETARWLRERRYRSVRLVTSEWHLPRARLELSHALGDGVEIHSDAVRSNPSFGMLVREYNKYLVRRIALTVGYSR